MHYSNVILAAASLASVAVAQTDSNKPLAITNLGITTTNIVAGTKVTVQWGNTSGVSGNVQLTLRSGSSGNLSDGTQVCQAAADAKSCSFTVPNDVATGGAYTIMICNQGGSTCNYSPMFSVTNNNSPVASGSASASASGSSASGTATEIGSESSATVSGAPTGTETVTATRTTPTNSASASATESLEPTGTESSTASSTESGSQSTQTGNAPNANEGSTARSSSLAMALCVFAAIFYLN